MNKVKTIKVKNEDGSVSEESYAIAADALNIDMVNGKNVQETIGTIDVDKDGDIATQLKNKIDKNNIIDNLNSIDANKVLSAKQGKVLNEAVAAANSDIKKKIYYFNTIAEMKKADLQAGDTCQTLGYYEENDGGSGLYKIVDDSQSVDDGGSIHILDNGLKAKLIVENEIFVEQYGLKRNDSSFDNSMLFQKLILTANNKGINIKFNNGQYYFSSPIVINERLTSLNIIGTGQKYQSAYNGTGLIYTGTNWFITTKNLWRCNFSEFQIECTNGGNAIYINGISYQTHLKRIAIKNAMKGILVDGFAYGYFDELNIFAEGDVKPEYGMYFNKNNTTEYLFIRDCTFGMNDTGDGIVLEGGIHYQIKDCDLVSCNRAVLFQPVSGASIRWLDVSFVDISRCKYGLYFNPIGGSISSGIISNIVINFSENANSSDEGITFLRPSSYITRDIKLKSIQLNALGTLPSYAITQAQNSVLNCELSISYNASNIPLKLKPTFYDWQILKEYYQATKQILTLNNNAGKSSYTYTMMTNSPFVEKPRVIVTDNKNMIINYSVSNTHKGNLDITVQFDTDKTLTGEYIICFEIPYGETYVKSLNS